MRIDANSSPFSILFKLLAEGNHGRTSEVKSSLSSPLHLILLDLCEAELRKLSGVFVLVKQVTDRSIVSWDVNTVHWRTIIPFACPKLVELGIVDFAL